MTTGLTAAVIGCGAIAQHLHLPGYHRRADVARIIGVDPEPARLAEVRAAFGVETTYADYREMLAHETPDVVSVCTPNVFHAEQAIAALEAGAHVLLEKPMALSLAEARAIAAAAEAAERKVMIGFSHRFHRGNGKAKALIEAGAIGTPFMVRVRFAHNGPSPGWAMSDWFYTPALAGGGALLDMGIHAIDLCQWFVGPITAVTAMMGTLRKPIALDDNAVLALAFGDTALGYIEVGWTSGPGFLGYEIYGDAGTIINDYATLRVCTGKSTPDLDADVEMVWSVEDDAPTTGGWQVEVDYFLDTLQAGGDFAMGLPAGTTALAVALGAIESAQNGRRVEVASLV
jgi:predicted dehydrogenase